MAAGEIAGITKGAVIGGTAVVISAIYLSLILRRKRKSTTVDTQQLNRPPEEQGASKLRATQELPGVVMAQELPAN